MIFWVLMFILAVLSRFVNLGDRVMSHDESLHTKFSWDLWKQGNFQHTPLMHGPVLFHATAFFYFLFGDSDFSARLYPAILGIIMVMMPKLFFERWLGKRGAMVASVLMLISPMIVYHHRYIREDTPSMFYTLVMLYAVLQYVDGVKPKQIKWLLVLSGANLLGLASKEVAFMYIAIFGGFLTLFWLVQVLAGITRQETKPVVGWILGVIVAVGLIGGAAFFVGGAIGNTLGLPRIIFQGGLFIALGAIGFSFLGTVKSIFGAMGDRAQSTFQVITTGINLGIFASLIMTIITTLIPFAQANPANPNGSALLANLVAWTVMLIVVCVAVVVGTALVAFRGRKIPWGEIAVMLFIAFAVCAVFLWVEQVSYLRNTSTDQQPAGAAPIDRSLNNLPIFITWGIGLAACVGLLALRFITPFFQEMKRYPVFDCLVSMFVLVLPWLTSIPMFIGNYTLDIYPASSDTIQAGIAAATPFIAVAIVGGLCWNPKVFVACAAVFYSLFAFFFTTVFTNPQGIISGAVGSLGYWLAQQGVRRGSQPQYYYLLIQAPVYEYLTLIGGFCAGIMGYLGMWRFRATRYNVAEQAKVYLDEPIEAESDEAKEAIHNEKVMNVRRAMWEAENMDRFPAIGFLAFWAGLVTFFLTISGEKMPWLTTHITLPLILISGWYIGRILDHVDWKSFFQSSWGLILLSPILVIAGVNVVGPFLIGRPPFTSLERIDLLSTGTWLFAIVICATVLFGMWTILRRVGVNEAIRVAWIGVFVLIAAITVRTAWRFTFITYDSATEYGVYAHGAPAMKTVMNKIEELSIATTDSMNLKVAYDNEVSWPGSWYFRSYPKAVFLGDTSGAADMESYAAILVSSGHRGNIEPQLGDRFYKFDYIRLWWPMQDYFDLNANRVNNVFMTVDGGVDPGALRAGLWDIWWNRDYASFGRATSKNFEISQWPVADRMVFFVRKDIAAQVWDLGVGPISPIAVTADPFKAVRCAECRGDAAIGFKGSANGQFENPHGARVGADGKLYVADTRNGRISVFDKQGTPLSQIGTPSPGDQNTFAPPGTLRDPWGVAIAKDGTVYVADTWNHRVQVFSAEGQFLRGWGGFEQVPSNQPGSPNGFWGPRDITIDPANNVYVADTGNKRIRVYTSDGQFIRNIGVAGAGPGGLNEPTGLYFDGNSSRLYVADTWNKRIQVFTADGQVITNWPVPNWYGPSEDTGNRPYLTMDTTGTKLFVSEPDTGRILVWDVSGVTASGGQQAILVFGSKGNPDLNRFQALGGLAADEETLYVVDAQGNRVVRFALAKLPGIKPLQPVVPPPPVNQPTTVPTQEATQVATQAATQVQPTQEPTVVQPIVQPTTQPTVGGIPGVSTTAP
jgi:sugar lactone lactonase YvrE